MNANPRANRLLAVLLAACIGAGPALAQPPWAGGGKGGDDKQERKVKVKDDRGDSDHKGKSKAKDKDKDKDKAKAKDKDKAKGSKQAARDPRPGAYFDDRNRDAVRTYYASAGKGGKACPPGLAKKNNGCMPPGQAKKWQVGQPLPRDVVFHPVPSQLVVTLPPVPVGHRYVQVAGDILLIAVGSRMVIDGINGLAGR